MTAPTFPLESVREPNRFRSSAVPGSHLVRSAHNPEAAASFLSYAAQAASPALPGDLWLAGRGLMQPVRARIRQVQQYFSAAEVSTGIFGTGSSVAEAIEDLRMALREHLDLLEQEDALSSELEGQRQFLRQHVRP